MARTDRPDSHPIFRVLAVASALVLLALALLVPLAGPVAAASSSHSQVAGPSAEASAEAGAGHRDQIRQLRLHSELRFDRTHRVWARGLAPQGATVVLQSRSAGHQRWRTRDRARVLRADHGFRLVTRVGAEQRSYRACLVLTGRDRCTEPRLPVVVQRKGTVTLVQTPTTVSPDQPGTVVAQVSPYLVGLPMTLLYRDPVNATWHGTSYGVPSPTSDTVSFAVAALPVGGPAVQLQVLVTGDTDVISVVSPIWTTAAYRAFPLNRLPTATGTLMRSDCIAVGPAGSACSGGLTPVGPGDTKVAAIRLPAGCRSVTGGTAALGTWRSNHPRSAYTASVLADGVPVWNHPRTGPGVDGFALLLAAPATLSLTTTFDQHHADSRPWFVSQPGASTPPQVICAA